TGYRCPVYRAVEPAPASRTEERAEMARYRALGFVPWGGVCTDVEEVFDDNCEMYDSSYARQTCREVRIRALDAGQRIYYQGSVATQVSYDARREAFTVELRGVMARLGAPGDQRYLTTGPLVVPRGRTATEGLANAAKAFGRFEVPAADLPSPQTFEREMVVEALVQPKRIHAPTAHNPAQISALEVQVVALRAFVPDLSWGAVIIRAPEMVPNYRCTPLDPSGPE
ncbi:MAG: hypothetical protein QF464_07155, partial [Myxococcota bacterium]|nr:hypothetical protein [Myxococcota bacterium]